MKVSRNWLQTYFDTPLPKAETIEELLTFHSSEIEEVIVHEKDTIFDVKVLPDKSAWLLSHRGVAKELSVILSQPLQHDPLAREPELLPRTDKVVLSRDTKHCTRYAGVLIEGVTVGPSPQWLAEALESIGQRSINNIVDATNYVMFSIGQPLHAFDADKLGDVSGARHIGVRQAQAGESIVSLTGESYTLGEDDMVIVDKTSDTPIGIAGIKGGKLAEVDANTRNIFVESAHFERTAVRLSSQRLKLRTDASQRFENGLVSHMAGYGAGEIAKLIVDIAGGAVVGYVDDGEVATDYSPVSVSLTKLNSVLGVSMTEAEVAAILGRFGYVYSVHEGIYTVTPPFERDDIRIAEDLIEEIGRIYGLAHVTSVVPNPIPLSEINTRFYYAERVRRALVASGFSEVYTSSFRPKDSIALANALASDKGYLRSALAPNIAEVLERNEPYKDLLGLASIRVFEIGTVFPSKEREVYLCTIGVRTELAYKEKKDAPLLAEGRRAVEEALGAAVAWTDDGEGVASFDIDATLSLLPVPTNYDGYQRSSDILYKTFSQYPFISRDIALWVPSEVPADDVRAVLTEQSGELLVRTTLFDVFEKEGRTSYAFRLVFQSNEKTLTDADASAIMNRVASACSERGWEVR